MNPDLFVGIKEEYLKPLETRFREPAVSITTSTVAASAGEEVGATSAVDVKEATENDGKMDVIAEGATNNNAEDAPAPTADIDDDAAESGKRKRDDRDDPHKAEFKKLTLKGRHQQKNRPAKEDRLCPAAARGEVACPFLPNCYYAHDIGEFLSRKPADISPVCYMYETYGHCPQGFMCRFGDSHIDRVTLTNKMRPAEQGGVQERLPEMNMLKKETQFLLRKKNAYFDHWKKLRHQKQQQVNNNNSATNTATTHANTTTEATITTTAADNAVAVEETAATIMDTSADAAVASSSSTSAVEDDDAQLRLSKAAAAIPSAFTAVSNTTSNSSSSNNTTTIPTKENANPIEKLLYHNPYYTHFDYAYNLTSYPSHPVKLVDFTNKIYVAPLTTVGNLPFRRILKDYGADITCGEMSMAYNLQCGQASEWALLRRHHAEDVFGIQVAGNASDLLSRCAQLLEQENMVSEFVDLNCGCPIDVVCQRGAGSSLLNKPQKLIDILGEMAYQLPSRSVTVKVRTGWDEKHPTTHKLIPQLQQATLAKRHTRGDSTDPTYLSSRLACVFIHGRSRLQRYSKLANWDYITQCARSQDPSGAYKLLPVIGNGDLFSYHDWVDHRAQMVQSLDNLGVLANISVGKQDAQVQEAIGAYSEEWQSDSNHSTMLGLTSCAMLGRGALIKPWLPKEIKEMRDYDISASERMDMLQRFCNYGLDHWGSDSQGVQTTRRFLLEWLSFLHRYVPQGITTRPQKMNQRPSPYHGRGEMESLLSSASAKDWITISEYFLGPVPEDYNFQPKHKSNAYGSEMTNNSSSQGKDLEVSNG